MHNDLHMLENETKNFYFLNSIFLCIFIKGTNNSVPQQEGPGFEPHPGLSVWNLHVLPVSVWVSSHSPKACRLGTR